MTFRDEKEQDALSPDDARLLDALVENNFDPTSLGSLSDDDRHRVECLMILFCLLEDYPVGDADDTLVHATMARVARAEDDAATRLMFDAARAEVEGTRRRIRLPDFISLAAVILIAASVIWPTTRYLRARSIDAGCANNLRRLAWAFGQYADDYQGTMPMASAGLVNVSGWNTEVRNTLNLGPLIEGSYCERSHMHCPGHRGEAGDSYSYQWQKPGQPAIWGGARVPSLVLGDLNPHVDAARSHKLIPTISMSPSHNGRGQNVLSADGNTIWLVTPLIRNDNIYLPRGVDRLQTGVEPADMADVFLAH